MFISFSGDIPPSRFILANQNQVIEYLVKKGYTKTEQTLRMEASNLDKDGRPVQSNPDEEGFGKYSKAFRLIRDWAESNLEAYKVRLDNMSSSSDPLVVGG